ncbi:hypothetical protein BJX96DRAFT_178064 [Aspergillus floccosus]
MSDTSHAEGDSYACPICYRAFDRRDHMRRHLGSHQNARPHKCTLCEKSYNRRDVLSRHYAIVHNGRQDTPNPNRVAKKTRVRANKACESCAASKLRCDNGRPCTRCKRAGRVCEEKSVDSGIVTIDEIASGYDSQALVVEGLNTPDTTDRDMQNSIIYTGNEARSSMVPATSPLVPMGEWQMPGRQDWGYPAYFEHIVMPPDPTFVCPDLPIDVSTYMQELDTDVSLDSLNLLDFVIDSNGDMNHEPAVADHNESTAPFTPDQTGDMQHNKERHPWLWVPTSNQKAFTDQSQISIDRDTVDQAASSPEATHVQIPMNDRVDQEVRDNLLQFISRVTKSKVSISAFPDPGFLDVLINTGISRRLNRDSWIHPGTLCYKAMRPELLTALIAAGCFEADNQVVRDLQYLQAFMVWVDIGMTCGYPRKMEIAESRFPQLCTALRRVGAFDLRMYRCITPTVEDSHDALATKWEEWATQESFKRLAYSALELDMRVAVTFGRNPATSYSEFTTPLPAASEEWLASSAIEWRAVHMGRGNVGDEAQASLRDILPCPTRLNNLSPSLDTSKARSVLLHGLAGQIFEFQKQVVFANGTQNNRSNNLQLAIRAQQQDLHQALMAIKDTGPDGRPEMFLLKEFLALSLYTNIEEIQRFAGKYGVVEARRAYSSLETWFEDVQSRNALWHAGQVLRAGRCIRPFQFRGYEAIMVYHASLVLWVYGVLHCATIKHGTTPSSGFRRSYFDHDRGHEVSALDSPPQKCIYLDGPLNDTTQQWLDTGCGCPGLMVFVPNTTQNSPEAHPRFCDLRNSNLVMVAGRTVLEQKYLSNFETNRPLPPLVQRLCNMMNELGALPKLPI